MSARYRIPRSDPFPLESGSFPSGLLAEALMVVEERSVKPDFHSLENNSSFWNSANRLHSGIFATSATDLGASDTLTSAHFSA